jgi:hypothetical protein
METGSSAEKLVSIFFEKGPSFKVSEKVAEKLMALDRAEWISPRNYQAKFARCHASYEIGVAQDAITEDGQEQL